MEDQNLTVTLTLDNDEELECDVLTIFSAGTHGVSSFLSFQSNSSLCPKSIFSGRKIFSLFSVLFIPLTCISLFFLTTE